MTDDVHPLKTQDLVALIERVFGEKVTKITRPGGPRRPVYRVWFGARTIIAAYRSNAKIVETERLIQSQLAPVCDRVPTYLDSRDGFIFQSDVGAARLSVHINALTGAPRNALARQAIASLLDIQQAAADTDLATRLAPINMAPRWTRRFATGPLRLAKMTEMRPPDYDWRAVRRRITPEQLRFTKSDCRSGNAALDDSGRLRWFDFELSGLRHGAEDLAWLAADEIWPIGMADMHALIREMVTERDHDDYMDMFEVYTALQISRRLRLILNQVRSGGWVAQTRVVKYDYVGSDPKLAARLADRGAWLAAINPMIRPWTPLFEHTARIFREVLSAGVA